MSLKSIKKQPSDPSHAERGEDPDFKSRLAMQQFLKHQAPILAAFARRNATDDVEDGAFEDLAEKSRDLAFRLAAVAMGKSANEVPLQAARHFRREAASIVSAAWSSDGTIDLDEIEKQVGAALKATHGHEAFYFDDVDWSSISPATSKLMSRISLSTKIAATVSSTYAFRREKAELVGNLVGELDKAVTSFLERLEEAGHGKLDSHTISQTASQNFCSILCSTYRRHAEEFLKAALTVAPSDRGKLLARSTPVERVVRDFHEWVGAVGTMALTAADPTAAPVKNAAPSP